MFDAHVIDPNDVSEAGRLVRRALAIWFGGCIAPFVLSFGGAAGGELALGGMLIVLIIHVVLAAAATVISFRLAMRALALNPTSLLAKATMFLNVLSAAAIVFNVGMLLLVTMAR